ncbi:MAG: glutamine synthetase beta-grasp domain-containing protein, partial [Blastocatellia bacterium]|nr:glutamine synthetase beta-grasp domain-containing protein [Blastocatellia bacterium]
MDPKSILEFANERAIEFVSFRFTDLFGAFHQISVPLKELDQDKLVEGIGFDASSLRSWAAINESDMLLVPDLSRYFIDPFASRPTLCLFCNIFDPITKESYWLDPRAVAQKAENLLRSTGIADAIYFGPEAEFFVFDRVSFHSTAHSSSYEVDSSEGPWNSLVSTLGYHIRHKEGYVPCAPLDTLVDFRQEVASMLESVGIPVECHHHEVATAGQCEIDFRFSTLTKTADNLMIFKYIVKNTAVKFGKTATFMPKPIYGDNGSGMHCHQSLWKGEKPLFAGDEYAGLSKTALYYIGGLLKHAPAIAAFAAPTTNSYK